MESSARKTPYFSVLIFIGITTVSVSVCTYTDLIIKPIYLSISIVAMLVHCGDYVFFTILAPFLSQKMSL